MSLSPGTRLGPYEIVSLIGAGGMGEVYRAKDARLGRDVAVKVLPEDFLEGEERRARFEREAKLLAALNHPNIAAIHSFEEIPGSSSSSTRHILVMELLEGTTLRDRLDSGPVSPKQTMDYALQIAKGLAAAHEKGIIHRDLKPENLFVSKDGHVKILDFGLAKKTEQDKTGDETSAPTESKHTEPGTVMGTVGYMSPEQVRGLPVDHRTDIFSFGAILYELLSGGKAFKKDTAADTMSAILKEEPPDLSESGQNIPPALERVVKYCLEKDRSNRFQSAKDIAFALSEASDQTPGRGARGAASAEGKTKVLVAAAVIVSLAAAGVFLARRARKGAGETGGMKRVAVLPFENLGASEDDYFADGMADEIRGKLTSLPGVEVIARASSTSYKKTTKTPNRIAQELGVKYLLTATVRWQKGTGTSRVHVSPELVEVKDSGAPTSKWQQPFDAVLTDVFQMQSDIATRVAQALGVALGAREAKQLAEKPTQNLAAYDAFLKGEEISKGMGVIDPSSIRKALELYEQAVALDPDFAQAWALVSRASSSLYFFSTPTPELAERARQAAEKAVVLVPGRSEGYMALGIYERLVVGDSSRALEHFARGQRIAPGDTHLLNGIALAEEALGRWDLAVEHFRQAERLDPRSFGPSSAFGDALVRLRRYPEAREACDRGLALAPANLSLIESKAMAFLGEGDLAGAKAALKAAPKEVEPTALVAFVANYNDLAWALDEQQRELLTRLTPRAFDDDRGAWGICLAQACALNGDAANVRIYAEEARKAFEEQLRAAPGDAQRHAVLGLALAYLGRKEEAIREGERSLALLPLTREAVVGPYNQHQLARIYVLVGEPERALDRLEPLLKIPYYLSPGWLRIDPNFDPLRTNPRFQKLVSGK
jgi:TolB-like protein/Flp pilus assembly protein TadD